MKLRCKEHEQHICLYKPDRSAMAAHSFSVDHCISFMDTTASASMAHYMGNVLKEAVEI
jgi:hypothetical protein